MGLLGSLGIPDLGKGLDPPFLGGVLGTFFNVFPGFSGPGEIRSTWESRDPGSPGDLRILGFPGFSGFLGPLETLFKGESRGSWESRDFLGIS